MTAAQPRYAERDQLDQIRTLTRRLDTDLHDRLVDGGTVCGIDLVRDRRIVATYAEAAAVLDGLIAISLGFSPDNVDFSVREEPF